jgi:hypothetical protein
MDWPTLIFGLGTIGMVVVSHRYLPQQPSPLATTFIHSLHAPGFAIIAAAGWWFFRRQSVGPAAYLWAAVIATTAAILGEAAQVPGPRNARLSDIGTDMIGIFGALGSIVILDQAARSTLAKRMLLILVPMTFLALFFTFRHSFSSGTTLILRSQSMPGLLSFEHSWESRMYTASQGGPASIIANPDGWPDGGGSSVLKVEAAGRWNVVLRLHPYPNWSGYENLSFVVASTDGKAHALTVAVSDTPESPSETWSRQYAHATVYASPRRIVIPLKQLAPDDNPEPLDFRHVSEVILTTDYQDAPTTLLLDDFRLE